MPAVSQALVEFANHRRSQPAPGIEVIVTPRYQITLQPDFTIAGPNFVSWIRCRAEESDEVIREARATVAARRLPVMWILDPQTEPPDFADYLARHCVLPDRGSPESAVMVLPISETIDAPSIPGLEIRDALVDLQTFRAADAVAAEAFGAAPFGDHPDAMASQNRRRLDFIAAGNRRHLLAMIDGEPAGAAAMTLWPPAGASINGGAVRPKFRGRGIYRALIAARMEIARQAGVEGLSVSGGPMSRPILERLGFIKVGWRRFYPDASTA